MCEKPKGCVSSRRYLNFNLLLFLIGLATPVVTDIGFHTDFGVNCRLHGFVYCMYGFIWWDGCIIETLISIEILGSRSSEGQKLRSMLLSNLQACRAIPFLSNCRLHGCPTHRASATCRTSLSFANVSSVESAFPRTWLAKPHCGLTPSCCNACSRVWPVPSATFSAACKTRALISSRSSRAGVFEDTTPRMRFLSLGRWRSGSKVPERESSYSR